MSLTPPVSKDHFHYANGDLYVEASGSNRHRRATATELKELFRPSKKSPIPSKDPPGHWYEAQLLHYGLPASKVKGTAAKRLLDAFNKGDLVIPKEIVNVERSLKKQWDLHDKRAKKEAAQSSVTSSSTARGTKRKAEQTNIDGRNTTSMDVNVNGMQFNFNFNMAGAEAPRDRAPSASIAKRSRKEPVQKEEGLKATTPKRAAGMKQTIVARNTGSAVYQRGLTNTDTKVQIRPVAGSNTRVKSDPPVNSQSRIKNERKIKTEVRAKMEPTVKDEYVDFESPPRPISTSTFTSPISSSLGLLNGLYEVSCPYVEEQWGHENLTIILCLESPRLWGSYDFGISQGIFFLDQRPFKASDEQLVVKWRGRETGEGEMSYGDDNLGWIMFLGNGRIDGCLQLMGDCNFTAQRVDDGRTSAPRSASSMRQEWEGYNRQAYDFESGRRWG